MTPELERALQTCASEPIHLSGAIQPHGYLISCRLPDWSIHHVSANIEALTCAEPDAMLRRSLREFITDDVIQTVAETVGFADPGSPAQRRGRVGAPSCWSEHQAPIRRPETDRPAAPRT